MTQNNYDIGSAVTVSSSFTLNGVAADPTGLTLTITDPTGSITTVPIVSLAHPATGTFSYQIIGSIAGIWRYRFAATGNIIASQDGDFNITTVAAGWTYSPDQLATSQLYQLRFMIGDNVPTDPQMADAEINLCISQRSSLLGAAAVACLALATKYSRSVDQAAGTFKTMFSQMSKAYFQKAVWFETQAAMGGSGLPYAGGISIADKQLQELNTDRKQPEFALGMHDSHSPVDPTGIGTEISGGGIGGDD